MNAINSCSEGVGLNVSVNNPNESNNSVCLHCSCFRVGTSLKGPRHGDRLHTLP